MGNKVGRPRLGVTHKVVIPPDLYAELRQIAKWQGIPISAVMRDAYRHYIEHVVKKRRGAA